LVNYSINGNLCINESVGAVPVLKTYVVILNSNCTPILSWKNNGILPVRGSPTLNAPYKQMGIIPEWGDMLSSISPDGNYIAFATNMGPPQNQNGCASFNYILSNINNNQSGWSSRMTHWCQLYQNTTTNQIICLENMTMINLNDFNPPSSTPLPSFMPMYGIMTLIFLENWTQYNNVSYYRIWQNNLGNSYQQMYFNTNGNNIYAAQPIY